MRRFAVRFLWSAGLALALLGGGCASAGKTLFTVNGPGWRIQQGQAIWRPGRNRPEFAGDVVLATDGQGRCSIEFAKTPLQILTAQTTPDRWLIRFPARHLGFCGRQPPPARLAWLHLPAGLAGQLLPAPFRFERRADGGWLLENTKSGETLEGFLAPAP